MKTRAKSRAAGGGPRLKNYTSESGLDTILGVIQRTLIAHGARKIEFSYEQQGVPVGITFCLQLDGQLARFCLPARLDAIEPLLIATLREAGRSIPHGDALRQQVARTGWANVRDWIIAQMTFLQTGMVRAEEIFLPYLLLEGFGAPLTYYEAFQRYQALPAPEEQRGHVRIIEEEGR